MTKALDDLSPEMKGIYRLAYGLLRSYFVRRDKGFIRKLREKSKLVVANSNFCASMYENWGFRVDKVIYPPLDCTLFKPVASKPAGDYALTYAGKETKYSVLKKVAEAGVKIKMFGSKTTDVPKSLLKQPNMEFVGKVSESELVDLYSNALFTLSVFTHEPFGYIPVESMACGTPVLTYAKQGPAESVVNGQTGWFVENDRQLVDVASRLFRDSYPSSFRQNCRKRALDFDAKTISKEWLKLIDGFVEAM
jgi:glycosyltransferase involved in cell wall biosynthesis